MLTLPFGSGHQLDLYSRLLELPAAHYLAYECYRAQATDQQADLAATTSYESLVTRFGPPGPEAQQFLKHGHTPRTLAFMALVAAVDGEAQVDASEEGLRGLSARLLVALGLPLVVVERELSRLEQDFSDSLTGSFLQGYASQGDEITQARRQQRRALAVCAVMLENDQQGLLTTMEEINEAEMDFLQPTPFREASGLQETIRRRGYGQLCALLAAHGTSDAARLPLHAFRQRLDEIRAGLSAAE